MQTPTRRPTTRSLPSALALAFALALALPHTGIAATGTTGLIPFSITPPDHLTLDGQAISKGQLTIEGAIAFSDPGGAILETTVLDPNEMGDDVVIDAVIGSVEPHFLFEVPSDTEVVQLSGNFNASDPDLPPAEFNLTAGVVRALDEGEGNHFIIALPLVTSDFLPQIADLGTNLVRIDDNTPYFCEDPAKMSLSGGDIVLDNGIDNPWFASCPNPLPLGDGQPHGSIGSGCEEEKLDLTVTGDCPGPVTINVCGGTAGGSFLLMRSGFAGEFALPSGACEGLQTGLAQPTLIGTFNFNPACCFSFTPILDDSSCGQLLQIVDLTTCQVSTIGTL